MGGLSDEDLSNVDEESNIKYDEDKVAQKKRTMRAKAVVEKIVDIRKCLQGSRLLTKNTRSGDRISYNADRGNLMVYCAKESY